MKEFWDDLNWWERLLFVGAGVMIIVSLIGLGGALVGEAMRTEAIREGVGEYYLDQNHQRQFRFIKPTPLPSEASGEGGVTNL